MWKRDGKKTLCFVCEDLTVELNFPRTLTFYSQRLVNVSIFIAPRGHSNVISLFYSIIYNLIFCNEGTNFLLLQYDK